MKPEQKEKTVQSMLATARRMKTIITNLLDINAVESGKLTVNLQKLDVTKTINEIVESFYVTAEKKGISIHYDVIKQYSVFVDTTLFHEVIENIISNAVKYSPLEKKVYITVDEIPRDHSSFIRIAVKDEGPGLTDDDKQKLFGKFQRLSAQPTGGEHSSGLGLAIVKKMVEAMNGTIYCESIYGQGATFIVEFPLYSTESL
jgi:signal transduction histidine kinase